MKLKLLLLFVLTNILLIVACTGTNSEAPAALEGPALVMFSTDN